MKYLPFLNGVYSVLPNLLPLTRQRESRDQQIFQSDDLYHHYLDNKRICRRENIKKYYLEQDVSPSTRQRVNHYLINTLTEEYPQRFERSATDTDTSLSNADTGEIIRWNTESMQLINSHYLSLFDALCCQVQEDLAIFQLDGQRDWLAAIHLCAPNHWAAADKIGRPFDAVHAPVPGMEKTMPHYAKMLQSVVTKGPFTRFAWGISTDTRLNHHPEPPPGISEEEGQGRAINDTASLFIRTERQNLLGFPEENAFLFTIRTYFYPVETLQPEEKKALWSAVRSMSAESLAYKGLTGLQAHLLKHLFGE